MSDFNSLVQYTVENISRPIKYIIYKLTEFIRVVDKFVFRQVPSGAASGYATIEKIEGNTVKFNQSLQYYQFHNCSIVQNQNEYTITPTSVGSALRFHLSFGTGDGQHFQQGHKVYYRLLAKGQRCAISYANIKNNYGLYSTTEITTYINENTFTEFKNIVNIAYNSQYDLYQRSGIGIYAKASEVTSLSPYTIKDVVGIDLTAIFGAGNEPTTVADFEAWREQNGLPSVADYNPGELISCKMNSVKSVGFNQWDEEWEVGSINTTTGQNELSSEPRIRSKNYISVFPSTVYRFTSLTYSIICFWYDENKNFISYAGSASTTNIDIISPSNAHFCRIRTSNLTSATYNHDICINISDPTKNGTYQPYMTDSADIDVTTITGINPNTNTREIMFSSGMKQADREGTVKDTLDLRSDTATVKVGSRAYQSGDESDTSVITDGTTTYYALTTPITYTDLQDANGNPLNPRYKVEQGGTEQVLPVNTSTPTTVAPTLTTTYTKDVH